MACYGQKQEQKQEQQDEATNLSNAEDGMPKNELGFKEQSIRAAFVRKVFLIVALIYGVVSLMSAVPFVHPPLMAFVKKNYSLYLISLITYLVVYFVLLCCDSVRRTYPINLISTAILTLSMGFVVMFITALYYLESVLMAMGIITVSCVGIALFAMVTKRDITSRSLLGFVFIIIMVLMMLGLLLILWSSFGYSRPFHIFFASIMALFFVVYLALYIQVIMDGEKYQISTEDHIFAATTLIMGTVRNSSGFILCIR
ncbi:hypothetical protein niasHS_005074 [Heterodera schachtii]|uniref:Uncharacterized protein n=2 Tax=Heterodera TaxID=34509 RepID=A0ABD2JLK5_HETSC